MDIGTILEIIGIFSGIVLGIIGAAPQIKNWSNPKPQLVLVYYGFRRSITDSLKNDYGYHLHLILNNDNILWHRSHEATDVKLECHIIDMNNDQCGDIQTFELSKNLPVGESVNKSLTIRTEECREELNPHTLVFKITCAEGQTIKRKMPFGYVDLGSTNCTKHLLQQQLLLLLALTKQRLEHCP
jgi:hypothetical protein